MQKVKSLMNDRIRQERVLSFEDVVDFINSENTKSNSKHSLFDHFKRNLFLNCTIPRFDPRNGLLGLKSALDMSGRSSSGVTVTGVYSNSIGAGGINQFFINLTIHFFQGNSIPDDDIQHPISVENSTSNSYISESSRHVLSIDYLQEFLFRKTKIF